MICIVNFLLHFNNISSNRHDIDYYVEIDRYIQFGMYMCLFIGSCVVSPTNVTTIANITMPLPEVSPSCEIVLAHDCSPQKLYTVVSTPVMASGARKIKVIVPHHVVEISRSIIHQGVVVSVDGTVMSMPSSSEPLVIRRSVNGRYDIMSFYQLSCCLDVYKMWKRQSVLWTHKEYYNSAPIQNKNLI